VVVEINISIVEKNVWITERFLTTTIVYNRLAKDLGFRANNLGIANLGI